MENVQNKTAMVTGGASGIGYCIVEELLRNNAKRVAVIDLPSSNSQNAIATLQKKFGKDRIVFFSCDVTATELLKEIFKEVMSALGGLDILINNAGILHENSIEKTFAVNVIALIHSSMLGLDYMGKHKGGKGGVIVNIASISALDPILAAAIPIYCASKHAVVGFSRALQVLYDKTNVRILVICPHMTTTSMKLVGNTLDITKYLLEPLVSSHTGQTPEHVASSIIDTIEKGENGSIWVVQNGQPPFAVDMPQLI